MTQTDVVDRRLVDLGDAQLEVFVAGPGADIAIAAMHPVDAMVAGSAQLLAEAAGARVACVNPRGAGGSTPATPGGAGGWMPAAAPPGDATLERMADDLDRVRANLGIARWILWGMSAGGFLSLVCAHRHPDGVAGLILESAGATFRDAVRDPAHPANPRHPLWRDAMRAAGLLDERDEPPRPEPATVWESLGAARVFRVAGGPALAVLPAAHAPPRLEAVMPSLWAYDARPWLAELAVPTLVLAGTADPVAPLAHVRAVHAAIAGSDFVAIDGAGHVPVVERRPEVAAAVRRFLARVA